MEEIGLSGRENHALIAKMDLLCSSMRAQLSSTLLS